MKIDEDRDIVEILHLAGHPCHPSVGGDVAEDGSLTQLSKLVSELSK